jgi:hypothetical protein
MKIPGGATNQSAPSKRGCCSRIQAVVAAQLISRLSAPLVGLFWNHPANAAPLPDLASERVRDLELLVALMHFWKSHFSKPIRLHGQIYYCAIYPANSPHFLSRRRNLTVHAALPNNIG